MLFIRSSIYTYVAIGIYCLLWMLVFAWRMQEPAVALFESDASEYSAGAIHLLRSGMYSLDGQSPTFEREPGYSVFLAGVYAVFGVENRVALFVIQAGLYLFSSLLFVREFGRFSGKKAAIIALVLLLTLPSGLHIVFSANREILALVLAMLLVAVLLRLHRMRDVYHALGAGILMGVLMLTYMPLLLLPLCLAAFLVFAWNVSWKHVAVFLLCAFLPIFVWGMRNMAVADHFALSGTFRPAVTWYVRGEQAEHVRGLEPFRCLWAEYISRDWSDRSPYCSFNGVKNRRWPDGMTVPEEHMPAGETGKQKILQYFPYYLWFAIFEILELHLPFVDSWGLPYNAFAAFSSMLLYVGVLYSIKIWQQPFSWLFLTIMAYTTAVFIVTDATPRYLMPIIFCYVALAAVGFEHFFSFLRAWNRSAS